MAGFGKTVSPTNVNDLYAWQSDIVSERRCEHSRSLRRTLLEGSDTNGDVERFCREPLRLLVDLYKLLFDPLQLLSMEWE